MLVFLFGAGGLAFYQVVAMEDQLDQLTQAVDKMDDKVKRAQYEKAKFYHIAKDVLNLAPKDPNADQVAVYFKLRQLQEAQPELMDLNTPSDVAITNLPSAQTSSSTNAPTVMSSFATNSAPLSSPSPATK
jgi:hypothetical protein